MTDKEEQYREFGAALDCLERLRTHQFKILKDAIEKELDLSSRKSGFHPADLIPDFSKKVEP